MLDSEVRQRAQAKAARLNISFAEYVRRLVASDLAAINRKADVSTIFDLANSDPETDIGRFKDEMIAEAVLDDARQGGRKKAKLKIKPNQPGRRHI